jgi:hypothetical protein
MCYSQLNDHMLTMKQVNVELSVGYCFITKSSELMIFPDSHCVLRTNVCG